MTYEITSAKTKQGTRCKRTAVADLVTRVKPGDFSEAVLDITELPHHCCGASIQQDVPVDINVKLHWLNHQGNYTRKSPAG